MRGSVSARGKPSEETDVAVTTKLWASELASHYLCSGESCSGPWDRRNPKPKKSESTKDMNLSLVYLSSFQNSDNNHWLTQDLWKPAPPALHVAANPFRFLLGFRAYISRNKCCRGDLISLRPSIPWVTDFMNNLTSPVPYCSPHKKSNQVGSHWDSLQEPENWTGITRPAKRPLAQPLQTRVAYSLRSMFNGLDGRSKKLRAEKDGVPSAALYPISKSGLQRHSVDLGHRSHSKPTSSKSKKEWT